MKLMIELIMAVLLKNVWQKLCPVDSTSNLMRNIPVASVILSINVILFIPSIPSILDIPVFRIFG